MASTNKSLNISLIQANLVWENKVKNLQTFELQIEKLKKTDLICLPEMFTTGFSMNAKNLAEKMNGPSVGWMKAQAKNTNAAICGSLIIEERKKYYNRFIWAMPNGDIFTYDKRHLFSPGNEHKFFTPGTEKIIINYKGWNICPFICYDLRFPVWSRNIQNEYDLLIYVASWPAIRNNAWESLLVARAIENQSYVIGANRYGVDGTNTNHFGFSTVIDYLGKPVLNGPANKFWAKQITINKKDQEDFRKKLPFAKDADAFILK